MRWSWVLLVSMLWLSASTPLAAQSAPPSVVATAPASDDTLLSDEMLDSALRDLVSRVKVDRTYDIPYLAGYSKDGKTVYLDRTLPRVMFTHNRLVLVSSFLVLHEVVEKSLLDQLGLRYQHAHQFALRIERDAVLSAGVSWEEYDRFMSRYITLVANHTERIPADLDLRPYEDEQDNELLSRMLQSIRKRLGSE